MLVDAVVTVVFGMPNCTRLNRLNASRRNCRFMREPIFVIFVTAKFQLLMPCPRRSGSLRSPLPSAQRARGSLAGSLALNDAFGTLKQLVLNHLPSLSPALPSTNLSQLGSTFGRSP